MIRTQQEHNWEMGRADWFAVMGASFGAFMAILDIQITNASLREIQGALSLDIAESGSISSTYLISEIIVIPLTATFSKIIGMRRYMIGNCVLFILASILCGFSWNLTSLLFARILQGLSGGTLIPMAFQTMMLYMPPHKKNLGLAIFGTIATLAPTLGPALGGWLTENYGWRSIFLINIIPGVLTILALKYGIPPAKLLFGRLKNFDIGGLVTLILGLGSLTYFLEEGAKVEWFSDNTIRICFIISLLALPLFVAIELIHKNPILNLRLLANRNFSFAAAITMFTATALYGGVYALSLYLSQIQGYSAKNIGQVMMWIGIPQLIVMPLMPLLIKKIDSRILAMVGLVLFAFSNYLNIFLNSDYGGDEFVVSLVIRAVGQPLFIIPLSALGMASITPLEIGNASSIYNVMRNLGGSIGIALTGTLTLSRENQYFTHLIQKLSISDWKLTEYLKGMQYYFLSNGADVKDAQLIPHKILVGLTHREALIISFSDIFAILSIGLVLSVFFVFFLRKSKSPGAEEVGLH